MTKKCPICYGEGKIDDSLSIALVPPRPPILAQLKDLLPNLTALSVVLVLAWILHAWVVAPSVPKPVQDTEEMQCSKACGPGRFKSYTYQINPWTEHDGSKWGKQHDPVAPKCECLEEKHEP